MQKGAITSALVIGVLGIGFWVWTHPVTPVQNSPINITNAFASASPSPADTIAAPASTFTHTYTNKKYSLSFGYPDGYSVRSTPNADGGGDTILIQNDTTKKGVQILITPYDDADANITEKKIETDIPDMKVSDPQPVPVGRNQGLAFISDNGAFDGNSREVWFVFKGNLYQISTYASYDDFVKTLFSTWKFN